MKRGKAGARPCRQRLSAVGRQFRARGIVAACGFALSGLVYGPSASGQELAIDEVKTAYIYNFAKYTEWPADDRSPALRICVAGPNNSLARMIDGLNGKGPVKGRPVEVKRLTHPADARGCHVLVLTAVDRVLGEWIAAVEGVPVLTVGQAEGFASAGGIVGLYQDAANIRFEINQAAAQRAKLALSSQLLKLARLVKPEAK